MVMMTENAATFMSTVPMMNAHETIDLCVPLGYHDDYRCIRSLIGKPVRFRRGPAAVTGDESP